MFLRRKRSKDFYTLIAHITAFIWNCHFYTVVRVYITKHSGTHLIQWHGYMLTLHYSEFTGKLIKKICGVQEMENILTNLFWARQLLYGQILQLHVVINIANVWEPIEWNNMVNMYVYIAFYFIVKYCLDGHMMIVNDRNMQLFLSKR